MLFAFALSQTGWKSAFGTSPSAQRLACPNARHPDCTSHRPGLRSKLVCESKKRWTVHQNKHADPARKDDAHRWQPVADVYVRNIRQIVSKDGSLLSSSVAKLATSTYKGLFRSPSAKPVKWNVTEGKTASLKSTIKTRTQALSGQLLWSAFLPG